MQFVGNDQRITKDVFKRHGTEWGLADWGTQYDVVAMLGPQNSGQSTLLNDMFGTRFSAPDGGDQMQPTKGIWISKAAHMDVLVMDMEGLGSRVDENELASARTLLTSVKTASVLIINIRKNVIGAANSSIARLLEMIFASHMVLFGRRHKTRLVFAIRNCAGSLEPDDLISTLSAEMRKIWCDMPKREELAHCVITDFFDCTFATFANKMQAPDKFSDSVADFRARFLNKHSKETVFDPIYWKLVSADKLEDHLAAIWDNATSRESLFYCDRNAVHANCFRDMAIKYAYSEFVGRVTPICQSIGVTADSQFATKIAEHCNDALALFGAIVQQHRHEDCPARPEELKEKCYSMAETLFSAQVRRIADQKVQEFSKKVKARDLCPYAPFDEMHAMMAIERKEIVREFVDTIKACIPRDAGWDFTDECNRVQWEVSDILVQHCMKHAFNSHEQSVQQRVNGVEQRVAQTERTVAIQQHKVGQHEKRLNDQQEEINRQGGSIIQLGMTATNQAKEIRRLGATVMQHTGSINVYKAISDGLTADVKRVKERLRLLDIAAIGIVTLQVILLARQLKSR
ncbi:root hair defective 3 GTP-binding protein-domain-containing protein [Thamnocephalis sphaerospora]|uniref:Root hair defective 3 GTP-binding protein-domain-containing protein n=1 Tax=Thamnocephalis sphaerospora TaxID=78915 RepID=A0A4P9XI72_9FUNG|nr:root hair defective 3 GTP-binding protein-domain-containing protein [Thamnocephalis sphaerospora]|eukprot:RKP05374.1 root hair defective 3 GTP-binding protein-domain-containing protein [Thamnocephalis sphaerospora]